jgi:glycosyltransferase involved in cell wall biosynthesis
MKKIAIFKPTNIRSNNAFATGQFSVFKKLESEYDVTYFTDDLGVRLNGAKIKYLRRIKIIEILIKVFTKFTGSKFVKLPFYNDINLCEFDIVITEGLHYPLLKYVQNYKGILIINDSITCKYILNKKVRDYIKAWFKSAKYVCVNEKIPDLYKSNELNLDTVIIGHAIDTKAIKFCQRSQSKGRLLSVGRLVEEKGYFYIIMAVFSLKKKFPSITLDIFGEGPLFNEIYNLITQLKLNDNVRLNGFINNELLISRLHDYDLFISHSIETPNIAEAFHMGNMEAMANGLPVITTDCGGIPFVVRGNALMSSQRNISSIIDNVSLLLQNDDLVYQYSKLGRTYIEENFSIDVIAKKWSNLLLGCINDDSNFKTIYNRT